MKLFLAGTSLLTAYGGPAYSVSRLATALADSGIEVGLWAPDGSAITTPLLEAESRVRRLSGSLTQAIEEFGRPDVVHDNGVWLRHNHQLAVVAGKRRIPRVVSTRGMLEPWAMNHKGLKKRIAWPLYQKRDLMRAAALHATTEQEAINLRRLDLGVDIQVIANGVDIPEIDLRITPDNGVKTALFLGRIYPVKGLPMLIEAWRQVQPSGWRLQIAGPDEAGHLAEIRKAVDSAGLSGVVSFLGPIEGQAKTDALRNADLFVLPTHSESFGMAVAEALAHGLPVLTTIAAPWPVLEEKLCGWRVEPSVEGITTGLRAATSVSAADLSESGLRGRDYVANALQWNSVAKNFVRLYDGVA